MKTIQKVLDHLPTIQKVTGNDPSENATYLALIHIESSGDPFAVSKSGSFHGLLQIGVGYLQDATDFAKKKRFHPRELVGDAERSIWAVMQYMGRYQQWHKWEPDLMALAHKAGAGTVRSVAEGRKTIDQITDWNTPEYLRRFRRAYQAYLIELTRGAGC